MDTATNDARTYLGLYPLTDLGNAERLDALHGDDIRWVEPWNTWMAWDGTRWGRADRGQIQRMAKDTVRALAGVPVPGGTLEAMTEMNRHQERSESARALAAMVDLAKTEGDIPALPGDFDARPGLFNAQGLTLDLVAGVAREPSRGDLLTKQAGAAYDADAPCPTWDRTLDRIFGGDRAMVAYFQRAVGYAMLGDPREQVMFILYGTGANGKSTVLNTLSEAFGDYARSLAPDVLISRRGEAHPTAIADLQGVRLAVASEVNDGGRLDEAVVKRVVDTSPVKARRMYQDFFEFAPSHVIFYAVNHKPVIRGADYGIWRRIHLVPFDVTIPEGEQDPHLAAKLRAELPGILAWAARGCRDYQGLDLNPPDRVRGAVGAYRLEMDLLGNFLEDCCDQDARATDTASDLYAAYVRWCEDNGEHPWTKRTFGLRLQDRGFTPHKGTGGTRAWKGLRLQDRGPAWRA